MKNTPVWERTCADAVQGGVDDTAFESAVEALLQALVEPDEAADSGQPASACPTNAEWYGLLWTGRLA